MECVGDAKEAQRASNNNNEARSEGNNGYISFKKKKGETKVLEQMPIKGKEASLIKTREMVKLALPDKQLPRAEET